MGGGRKQFQVLVNPDSMLSYGVNLHEIEAALQRGNSNVTGGYLDGQGPNEFLVRSLGRVQSVEDLRKLVVKIRGGRPVLLARVANVIEGPEVKRGDSSSFVRQEDGRLRGRSLRDSDGQQAAGDRHPAIDRSALRPPWRN